MFTEKYRIKGENDKKKQKESLDAKILTIENNNPKK